MVSATESYDKMAWFANRKFDRVLVINVLNNPESNINYRWVLENAGHVLKPGGILHVTAASPVAPSLDYLRNSVSDIRSLGYEFETKGQVYGNAKVGNVLGEQETDKDITERPVESRSNYVRSKLKRPEPEGTIFTVERGDPNSNFRDTTIRLRKR
jgi:hypothetical protein